jgi:hypothetical protein
VLDHVAHLRRKKGGEKEVSVVVEKEVYREGEQVDALRVPFGDMRGCGDCYRRP